MSQSEPGLATTAQELRRVFDESFALPPRIQAPDSVDFLAIRVGNGRYALRVSDLTGVEGRRKIAPLPSGDPALLGIAAAQGRLAPVYSLAALIGSEGGQEEAAWLAICGRDEPVGLAFAALDGHLRVPAADVSQPGTEERKFVDQAIRLPSEARYVLDISAILAAIGERTGVPLSVSGR